MSTKKPAIADMQAPVETPEEYAEYAEFRSSISDGEFDALVELSQRSHGSPTRLFRAIAARTADVFESPAAVEARNQLIFGVDTDTPEGRAVQRLTFCFA